MILNVSPFPLEFVFQSYLFGILDSDMRSIANSSFKLEISFHNDLLTLLLFYTQSVKLFNFNPNLDFVLNSI